VDLERALKNARRLSGAAQAQASDGQLQIFDPAVFGEEAAGSASPADTPTSPPPTRRDIMRYEQEAIGYSISYDLLEHYDELIDAVRAVSPFEMTPRMEGKSIYVAGFVDHVEREGALIDEETDMALDLEGHVVKIPPAVSPMAARVQNSRSPVLVEGIVRCSQSECFLTAQRIYLLEEVARKAEEVAVLRLDLRGENARTLGILRSVLKPYKGRTRVEIENFEKLSWWRSRRVGNAQVFFCPPLYQALCRVLPEKQITLLNSEDQRVRP